jgi:hypothetical protein
MRIDVVRPVLRIVLHNEDGRIIPVGTMRHCLNYAPDREIVISD